MTETNDGYDDLTQFERIQVDAAREAAKAAEKAARAKARAEKARAAKAKAAKP